MEDVILSGDPDEIKQIAEMLKEFKDELTGYQEELAPIKEELNGIYDEKNEAKQAYLAIVAKIVERESELTRKRNEQNNAIRQAQAKVASAERQLQQALRVERLKAESEKLDKQLESVLVDAKWFSAAFKHQFEAAKKITFQRKMILADAPGLGKTLTALATCDLIKEATKNASTTNPYGYDHSNHIKGVPFQCGRKILYVCPAPLLKNVVREVQLWTNRSPILLGGQSKAARNFMLDSLKYMDEFLVVINYEAWRRDKYLLASLKEIQFDTVILDEAHTLKDRKTGAFQSIQSILTHYNDHNIETDEFLHDRANMRTYQWDKPSNRYVPFVICMTGTPILNRPQDLYSLLNLVDPDHFNHEMYFLRDFCQQDWYTKKWEFQYGGLDRLAKRISNIYLRRTKRDAGIILPGKHEEFHELELDKENYPLQAKARQEMKTYGAILLAADKTITAAAEIAIITRLRQIETWPAGIEIRDENKVVQLKLDVEESQKIDYVLRFNKENEPEGLLADLCEGGLREGASVVVFSQFKAPLRELQRRCESAGISAAVLDGETPQDKRDEIIKDFDRRHTTDESAKYQVVLANYRVGGVGVTLTRATELIMLDSEWSSGREEQATDRIHRIGQTEDVTIHKITVKDTIDPWLDDIVAQKRNLVDGFENKMTDYRDDLKKFLEN